MLNLQVIGEGSTSAVFLHGFLGQGRNLHRLAHHFLSRSPNTQVLLVDLPGHGSSPPLPPQADLRAMAAQVLARLPHLASFRVIGHSLGGRVGLAMLELDPVRVARLDLLDITPGPTDRLPSGVLATLCAQPASADSRDAARDALIQDGVSPELASWLTMNLRRGHDGRMHWIIDREALAALRQSTTHETFWGPIEADPSRVRLVFGANSEYVPGEDLARLRQLGVRTYRIPGAGHFLHTQAPQATVAALVEP